MKKSDIKNRIQEIDNRLSEFPTICEREKRELTEAETREMTQLAAERSDLQRQLADIERGENRQVHDPNKESFSLFGAIRDHLEHRGFNGEYADECRAMAEASKLEYQGHILMKTDCEHRALDGILTAGNNYTANSHNGGQEAVRTDVLPIREALYNYTVLERGGANIYNDLVGNVKIPTMSKIAFGFKGENVNADNVTPTFGKSELTPNRLTGEIWISKMLINQTSEDLERRIRLAIARAVAESWEMAVLGAAHGSPAPHDGVMYGATTVAVASLTYDTILGLSEAIYNGNMRPTFIVDPKAARILKQKPRLTYDIAAIMSGGRVDDEPTYITNNLKAGTATSGAVACVDLSGLHMGTWGGLLDITIDEITQAKAGKIGLILNYYCDWAWSTENGTPYAVREITTV